MGLGAWIIVGLIAGALARRAVGSERRGCLTTLAIGVVGGIVGGAIFQSLGSEGLTGFSIWSIFVAFAGACILLLVVEAVTRG